MRVPRRAAAVDAPAEIIDLAHDGRGIARINNKVTFIAGALPGERVRFHLTRQGRHTDEGEVGFIEQESKDRVTPRCPHFGVCGGCTLQHLSTAAQVVFKQKQMLDALERIGKVRSAELAAAITGPEWSYRRRARLSVYLSKDSGVRIGFREKDSPFTAQLESCDVLDERVGRKLVPLARCIERLHTRVSQIEVAAADTVALVFRVMAVPTTEDLGILKDFGQQEGFEILLQTGGPETVCALTPPATPLAYSPDGSDLRLGFRPLDFIQVNGVVNQLMVRQALDWLALQSGTHVLELFSGLGNFSLPLARTGARVTAVEGEAGLVEKARENARDMNLDIRFEKADLFKPDPKAGWLKDQYDAVLLDPPRAGAREVLPHVAARKPARILYVSCHPGTLARDAAYLVHEQGYRLKRAGILDMFPHTTHVESMALFIKSGAA
jgi:23S rRNA (uracil1939-C5)-methyltransferase